MTKMKFFAKMDIDTVTVIITLYLAVKEFRKSVKI